MNTEQQQQRIMGYFIEEAKDHLNTIEQGVLNLQDVLLDTEMRNEMFRAAHSIKGGAAMLGVVSVQHISHRLEDYFKILQEHSNIQVDERLKSLFLAGFDRLQELIEQLEVNFKISDELATSALESVKPIFLELESHLSRLIDGGSLDSNDALAEFQVEVANKLRDMLQLFKQEESLSSRRELESICSDLLIAGRNSNLDNWCELIMTAKAAIAFEDNSYRTLAPITIKYIKQAQDLVSEGKDADIAISSELLALIPTTASITSFADDEDMTIFMDNISDFDSGDVSMDELFSDAGLEFDNVSSDFDDLSNLFDDPAISQLGISSESGEIVQTDDFNTEDVDINYNFDLELENLFQSTPEDVSTSEDSNDEFADFGLEDLLQESITDSATASDRDASSIQDDDLGLEDFFSATDEDNLESLQSIDARTWDGEVSEQDSSGDSFDEFTDEFSMVTEVTEVNEDINTNEFQPLVQIVSNEDITSEEIITEESVEDEVNFDDLSISSEVQNGDSVDDVAEFAEFGSIEFDTTDEPIQSSIIDEFSDLNSVLNSDDRASDLDSEREFNEDIAGFVEFSAESTINEEPVIIVNEFDLDEPDFQQEFDGEIADFAELSSSEFSGAEFNVDESVESVIIIDESDLQVSDRDSEREFNDDIVDFVEFSGIEFTDEFIKVDEPVIIVDEFDLNQSELSLDEPDFQQEFDGEIVDFAELSSSEFNVTDEPVESVIINEFDLTQSDPDEQSFNLDSEREFNEDVADFAEFGATEFSDTDEPLESVIIVDEFSDLNQSDLQASDLDSEQELNDDIADFVDSGIEFTSTDEPILISDEFSDLSLTEEPSFAVGMDDVIQFADVNAGINIDEFDELDTIIDAPVEVNESIAILDLPSFDDLETLIELPPVELKKTGSDDFDDLEELLRDSSEVGGTTNKVARRPTPVKRQASKIISQTMKVDVKHLDSLNNLVGELVVNRNLLDQDQEKMQQFLANLLNQVQMLSDVSQKMRDQYDRSLLESSLVATREQSKVSSALMMQRGGDDNLRSRGTSSDFDSIELDRFSDFHALSQEIIELIVRVRESASDIEFVVGETEQVTRQLGVITNQVQDDLKQSRMVPFAQIADRLPRAVRDLAIKTGKEADIDIRGRETLIDKAILEQLYDPMTHLVSNAIVHGLEDPNTRTSLGKQAKGIITVRAYHQGNQTIISVGDDGAGIDIERVKRSAVTKGVRTQEEVDQLSDEEVFELLFEAGFSTKTQADEFAGRGVGLDVVTTALSDIRGTVFTESTLNKGTSFTIRLPLTLSISKAMLCVSNRTRIAFPVDGFEDMVEAPQNQIFTNEQGQSCLTWRNTTLPFQPLSSLLNYSRQVTRSSIYNKQEDDVISIIVLRNDVGYLALQVDQFIGESEIVIKQLEGPIPKPVGIAGATILGDGQVMAIANVLELFDIASGRLKPTQFGAPEIPLRQDEAADPIVLIVDDSITVRELLSLTFSKVGYRVEQAKDGKDAWEKLRAGMQCNLIFCDIEMPRMDGLELLSRIQKDEFLSKIPIAMLTSRTSDRHRNSARELGAKGYFTKPYLEEEVITGSKRLLQGELLPY